MAKVNVRLDAARKVYREALDAARANPSPEAWARLLAAGKDLSAAEEPRSSNRSGRRARRTATPTYRDLEGPPANDATDPVEAAEAIDVVEAVDAPAPRPQEFEQAD